MFGGLEPRSPLLNLGSKRPDLGRWRQDLGSKGLKWGLREARPRWAEANILTPESELVGLELTSLLSNARPKTLVPGLKTFGSRTWDLETWTRLDPRL